jgi:hypothetical protein
VTPARAATIIGDVDRPSTVSGALCALTAALALASEEPRTAEAPLAVDIAVHARAIAPGEPIRVEVTAPGPLETLGGELRTASLFFVKVGATPSGGERWSGWSMIPLDGEPGPALLEIHGRSAAGGRIAATRTLVVEAREFPSEELGVEPRYVEPPPEVRARLARERETLDAVYALRSSAPLAGRPFLRPVPGEPTSRFGTRRTYNGRPRSPHPGLDLRAATGTPVQASGAGRVRLARDLYYSGETVILDHGGGLFTVYAHLSRRLVEEGEDVPAGALVGLSGATGRVTGPHLHWGAKLGDLPFDPAALLDERLFPSAAASGD